jgi:RNA polymerase sigma-70 factor (ECF subfamily)
MFAEDRDYVERILAGEPELFEHFMRRYARMGGAIAFGIVGDFHQAEDIVQEAFIKAFRSLHALREPEKFRLWFASLVRSRAFDALRQRRGQKAAVHATGIPNDLPSSAAFRSGSSGASLEEEEVRKELRQKILDAIEDLPSEDRLVVVLKHMEGLSYKEISEITGASVSSVESRLFRAREALRRKLDPTTT